MKQGKIFFMIALMIMIFAMAVNAAPVLVDKSINYTTGYANDTYHAWAKCTDVGNLTAVFSPYINDVIIGGFANTNSSAENNTWTDINAIFGSFTSGNNITFEIWCLNNDTKLESAHENVSYVIVNAPLSFEGYNITPEDPTINDDINISVECTDFIDESDNITGYATLYLNGTVNETFNQTVTNGTMSEVYILSSTWTSDEDTWTFELFCEDGTVNTSKTNVSKTIRGPPVQTSQSINYTTGYANDTYQFWSYCSESENGTLLGFTTVYVNSVVNDTYNKSATNATWENIVNLTGLGNSTDVLTAEFWCYNELYELESTHVNVSYTIDDPTETLQDQVRDASLILNSIMAVLILGAIILPAGLIFAILNGNLDMSTGIITVVTIMGLAILIMMFYFIKSAIIDIV